MDEIRTEQLAFSEEEAAQLLNEKLWLDIGLDNLSVLLERTEGWPAGIYLASLSLRMREDKLAFIASFGGSNRYVVDLLREEVLAGLSEEVREFLLLTSVLEKMTGSLCDTVVGREDSGMLLTLAEGIPYEGPLPDGTSSVEAGVAILRAVFGLGGVRNTLEAARRAVALGARADFAAGGVDTLRAGLQPVPLRRDVASANTFRRCC